MNNGQEFGVNDITIQLQTNIWNKILITATKFSIINKLFSLESHITKLDTMDKMKKKLQ